MIETCFSALTVRKFRGAGGGWFRGLAIGLLLACPLASAAPPPRGTIQEFELKAAALHNIIAFTDWPVSAFASPDAPLIVGVLGSGPIGGALDEVIGNETVHGRRVTLEHYRTPADLKRCHVLFIAESQHGNWRAIRAQFAGRPVLTVSDAASFAAQGGLVQFGIEHNRLKLAVNLHAIRAAGLTISSKVLRLAEVIGEASE